jgi:FG-GAP repeat
MTTFLHPARCLRTLLLLPLLFAAFTLTGCGGGDGDSSAPPPTRVLNVAAQDIKTLRLSWTGTEQATGYRLFVQTDASSARVPVATLPANTTQHDISVFLPDQVNARYILQACNAAGCADTAPANVATALLNSAVGHFKTDGAGDQMGIGVALSADGSTLAVGAPGDDHQIADSGAVHLFTRGPTGWVTQALVKAPTPATDDRFGVALALSSDGQRLVVGASGHAGGRGAVHSFEFIGGQWVQTWFQIDPFPWTALDDPRRFGGALAMSADGNTLVVGRLDGDYTALVFGRDNGQWASQAAVLASGAFDGFAYALSGDGNTLVIGRPNAATGVGASGVVDVYERILGVWQSSTTQLIASNTEAGDSFGWSVSISGDGQTIAVGAPLEDGESTGINGPDRAASTNSGAVYVFARSGNTWHQQAYVKASNTGASDWFGHSVALSNDGNSLAVTAADEDSSAPGLDGAQGDDSMSSSGAAYVFHRQAGAWQQRRYVKASSPAESARFGESLALSLDGQSMAVGAVNDHRAAAGIGDGTGAVYLY